MKIQPLPTPPPVRGFRFAGVHGGLKAKGKRDLALVVADRSAVCAAAFTRNRAAAAPVLIAREHVRDGQAQAVMINSGNANAATGERGVKFAGWACRELAGRLSIDPSLVIPCSTGVIGVELERVPFARAISLAVDGLSSRGFMAAARAMMTSDAFPKWSHRVVEGPHGKLTIAGMAKGAGMIHPDMATMLAVILTDAPLGRNAAERILAGGLEQSFNRISVDGDTSTNDSVILMTSAQAPGPRIDRPDEPGYDSLASAIRAVMDELARLIVRDGEGATKLVDVVVEGADDDEKAGKLARAVATSVLVKAAFAGADPNWGRFVCAMGNAGVELELERLLIDVDDVALVREGCLISEQARRLARKAMRGDAFTLRIRTGNGEGRATVVTSDLSEAYLHFNSAYTS